MRKLAVPSDLHPGKCGFLTGQSALTGQGKKRTFSVSLHQLLFSSVLMETFTLFVSIFEQLRVLSEPFSFCIDFLAVYTDDPQISDSETFRDSLPFHHLAACVPLRLGGQDVYL